ncbi:MAG TPA: GAF domain-containing protein [Acidimicrobiales bacterium]|nr:GAF domain-containing protein [Acidimicrobiales bacterium]
MDSLDHVIARLAEAADLAAVQAVVRRAPRDLVSADGATFVLRDYDMCFYADEDAASPLWKGQRFPIEQCISGWAMLHEATAVVPDITTDDRIPLDAYLPTFVRSLVMVPVGVEKPVAAIGSYWSRVHRASDDEVRVLEDLAQAAGIALERVGLGDAPFLRPSIREG